MSRGSRNPSAIFKAVLSDAEKHLALASNQASSFRHRGILGDERAAALMAFLQKHFPPSYGVGKGEAMDFRDRKSGQLDIVIYDRSNSAPVHTGSENLLVPCEALLAVIEVKTTLSQVDLESSYKAAQLVHKLAPFKTPFIGPRADGRAADDKRARCMFSIFAYESNLGQQDWMKKEFGRIVEAAKSCGAPLNVIERVVVLGRGMINPCSSTGKELADDDQGIFLEYYLNLVNFLYRERARRKPVDWQVYSGRSAKGWSKIR